MWRNEIICTYNGHYVTIIHGMVSIKYPLDWIQDAELKGMFSQWLDEKSPTKELIIINFFLKLLYLWDVSSFWGGGLGVGLLTFFLIGIMIAYWFFNKMVLMKLRWPVFLFSTSWYFRNYLEYWYLWVASIPLVYCTSLSSWTKELKMKIHRKYSIPPWRIKFQQVGN